MLYLQQQPRGFGDTAVPGAFGVAAVEAAGFGRCETRVLDVLCAAVCSRGWLGSHRGDGIAPADFTGPGRGCASGAAAARDNTVIYGSNQLPLGAG